MRIWGALCVALGLGGLALWAAIHPLAPAWACGGIAAAWIALVLRHPPAGLAGTIALWPVIDLAPWSGHIHLTESDALALAAMAALGLRAALGLGSAGSEVAPMPVSGHGSRASGTAMIRGISDGARAGWGTGFTAGALFTLVAATVALSAARGWFAPAAPGASAQFSTDWLAGLDTPMNALRLAKPYAFALLLAPFLQQALSRGGERMTRALLAGMTLGLATCSLATLWERVAYPGLTNFSADYRTTALFWEMNVGGAALDGWIALTVPFAVALALDARRRWEAALAAIAGSLGAYAAFTTFSRGLYAALGAGLLVMLAARYASARAQGRAAPATVIAANDAAAAVRHGAHRAGQAPLSGLWARGMELTLAACLLAALALAFPGGGYRGTGALMLCAIASLAAGPRIAGLGVARTIAAALLACGAAGVLIAGASLVPKGPYLVFALGLAATIGLAVAWRRPASPNLQFPVAALALATVVLAGNVGVHWGDGEALAGTLAATLLAAVPLLAQGCTHRALWRADSRTAAGAAIVLIAGGLGAATLGSYYAMVRFATVDSDLKGRGVHWRDSLQLARTPAQQALGIGMGRYPQDYFWSLPQREFPGTWALAREDDERFLRLGGPRYSTSFGDLFRVSQRVATDARGPFSFRLRIRTAADVGLHLEVCRKHLLYADDCSIVDHRIKGSPGWQSLDLVDREGPMSAHSPWFAPRLALFSIGISSAGTADVDDIALTDAGGRSLLANGDFSHGVDRWFFSSDRHHLPWHAKSIFVHLFVEQGIAGLAAVGLAMVAACARLARAASRGHPFAPVVLASIAGFVVVGLFDSLLDVPRDALAFLLLLWVGLAARAPAGVRVSRGDGPSAGTRPGQGARPPPDGR